MYIDIFIFALIAVFLIYRLNAVLGTKHGEERERPNPFALPDVQTPRTNLPRPANTVQAAVSPEILSPEAFNEIIDAKANAQGQVEGGLTDIAKADPHFNLMRFMTGAKAAFEMIVTAYAKGDVETLKPLLSPALFNHFESGIKARTAQSHTMEVIIHRIKAARMVEAHLGGTMAYITIDFDVEETTVTRNADGAVVDGDPDYVFSIKDVWTFTRDTRSNNPAWILIETRTEEQ